MVKILIVDDEKPLRETMAKWFKRDYECLTACDSIEALKLLSENNDVQLMISDVKMPAGDDGVTLMRKAKAMKPNLAVIMLTAYGSVELAVEAMRDGADDFFQKPITDLNAFELRIKNVLKTVSLEQEVQELKSQLGTELENFTGKSPAMENIYRMIRKLAPSNANVLVEGPSGTGKELVARAIHNLSNRSKSPFIAVECAALPGDLLAAELFGSVKGGFTGATDHAGRFEAANGGTLFLDEIGDIDQKVQVAILRALESRVINRVGDNRDIPVDFRLITATNKDLKKLIVEGKFREDLYYRLNVIDLHLPALKDRQGDISLLTARFLKEFSVANGGKVKGIEPAAMKALENYDWPGNVRQLRNVIERMVVLASDEKLTMLDLPLEITESTNRILSPATSNLSLADTERARIMSAIDRCKGNKSKAAIELGISRRTLHRKLKEWE